MKTTLKTPLFNPNLLLPFAADVSKEKSNYACELGEVLHETEASNSRSGILDTLAQYRALAREAGFRDAVLILEPTAGYERPLVRAARSAGIEVFYANTEAVKKLQVVQDGTCSKSDRKDPRTILTVAKVGRIMRCRDLSGRWQALRHMNAHHHRLETDLTRVKNRIRKLQHELFPTLDFSRQWFFGKAASVLAKLYRLDPYAMRDEGFDRSARRLRDAGLRPGTVRRMVDLAAEAVKVGLDPVYCESLALEAGELYEALSRTVAAKGALERRFEAIYDELLESGEAVLAPVPQVMPKVRLAMIHGETGPLDDFQSIRQLRKYAGMNVRLRESGQMNGARRMSKKGRPLLRKLLTQTCLPLVRKGYLFGEEYHRRKGAGSPGAKAMSAIANKYLAMLFSLHRNRSEFEAQRVHQSRSDYLAKAA